MKIYKEERLAILQLYRTRNVGPVTFQNLMSRFGTAIKTLESLPNITARHGKELLPISKKIIDKELSLGEKLNATLVVIGDKDFPKIMQQTKGTPSILWCKGYTHLLREEKLLSIVGSRNADNISLHFAYRMAEEIGKNKFIIASGLARGIDTSAHKGALKTGTIAVMSGGVDIVYPSENIDLYNKICNQGCVISEMPLKTNPNAKLFPARNRIIAGLSLGTYVAEAELKSGSLITANIANNIGRDVFATPGHPSNTRFRGCNKLIKDGAFLVEKPEDIIDKLSTFVFSFKDNNFQPEKIISQIDINISDQQALEIHKSIVDRLLISPTSSDNLARELNIPINIIRTILTEMELADIIRVNQSGIYSLFVA